MRRRSFLALLLAATVLRARAVSADPLPAMLQADLLAKVAAYDKNLRARAGEEVRTVIVTSASDEDARWASQLRSALAAKDRIAGLPHSEAVVTAGRFDTLAAQCRTDRVAIVVVASSLLDQAPAIAAAFEGSNVLTVAPDAELTRRAVVLGFELVSGKPKLFLSQARAAKQNVAMSAEVMKLMTVFP